MTTIILYQALHTGDIMNKAIKQELDLACTVQNLISLWASDTVQVCSGKSIK